MRMTISVALAVLAVSCAPGETSSAPSTTTTVSAPAPSTTASPATTSTTTAAPQVSPRRPVVLDYSPTVSDLGALAFLASHPDLELIGVTLPGTGESHCEPGVAHTRGVLTALGLGDVPVACGPEEPVTGFNAFPTSWRVASDEMDLPEAPPNEFDSAQDLIGRLVDSATRPVELVAVGPLTNVALALQSDPSLVEGLAGITIMGGAVDVPGNVFRNDVAEWNIWVDPTAAGVVLASGAPVTLIPLDATNHLPSGRVFYESLDDAAATPAAELVRDAWAANGDWIDNRDGFFYFWDELAAAVLIDESIVTFEERSLVVDDEERETKGWTREDPEGSPVRVAVSADRLGFEQLFLDTLVGEAAQLGYVTPTDDELGYLETLADIEATAAAAMDAIFAEAAADVAVDEEETFLQVVALALPAIFAGPWEDRLDSLDGLDVPVGLRSVHVAYVAALREFAAAEIAASRALGSGDFEAFAALFGPVSVACTRLQAEADIRLVPLSLGCPEV
jgi:inosine-uridine nucleoside N-ribohydrolase